MRVVREGNKQATCSDTDTLIEQPQDSQYHIVKHYQFNYELAKYDPSLRNNELYLSTQNMPFFHSCYV